MKNNPVRVLHFAPGFLFGGIESRLLDWFYCINREEIMFDLLKHDNNPDGTTNITRFQQLGGNVYNLPQFSSKHIFKYIVSVKKFFLEHQGIYDVVHSHSLTSGLIIMYYAKKYGIEKRILHARTNKTDGSCLKKLLNNFLKYLAPYFATNFFACSESAAIWGFGLKRTKKNEVTVFPNSIQTTHFKFNPIKRVELRKDLNCEEFTVIGTVCRLTAAKNLTFLINVYNIIKQKHINSKLLIIGDGPLRPILEKQIRDLSLIDSVILLGQKNDISGYLSAMDVFVFPSLWEGFGTVAIEAQASGLPTFISDGVPDDVMITPLARKIKLCDSLETWANIILASSEKTSPRSDAYELVANKGFDVQFNILQLSALYTSDFNH